MRGNNSWKSIFSFSVHFFALIISLSAQNKWVEIGPTGGNVNTLRCFPKHTNILLCSLQNGGLYRSTNEGDLWENIFTEPVYDISIADDSLAYAAGKNGLYLSKDYGVTWKKLIDHPIRQVIAGKNGIVTVDTLTNAKPSSIELLLSKDYGSTWVRWKGTASKYDSDLQGKIKRFTLIFHSTGIVFRTDDFSLYRTKDNNWNEWINLGEVKPNPNSDRVDIKLVQPTNNVISIYVYSQYHDMHPGGFIPGGIFESVDSGKTWNALTGTSVTYATEYGNEFVLGSETGSLKLLDKKSLTLTKLFSAGGEITGIVVDKWDEKKLIISTKGGIFKSIDGGKNWSFACNGIKHPRITAIQTIQTSWSTERLLIYAHNNGIWKSDDNGKNWQLITSSIEIFPGMIKHSLINPNYILAGGHIFYYSSDGGLNWKTALGLKVPYFRNGETKSIEATNNFDKHFYVTYYAHSNDHFLGNYLASLQWSFPDSLKWNDPPVSTTRNRLMYDPHKNYLWSSYLSFPQPEQALFIEDLTGNEISRIFLPNRSSSSMFTMGENKIFILDWNGQFWYSSDYGITWNNSKVSLINNSNSYLDFGIPYLNLGELKYSPSQKILYLAHPNNGLYFSRDDGKTMLPLNNGFNSSAVYQIEFSNLNPSISYAATGDGLYKIDISTDISKEHAAIPYSFHLAQNYPNPFNPETVISWQIAVGSHVTLKIYDVLGNEVATLVDKFHQAGNYNSPLSIINSPLSSGVYFYRLQAGEFSAVKKMLLLK